ncbi:hypothetical protein GCM10010176_103750 [Nonomuraea spiralis]|nr:hypothetical protein GCM10010176_103750 [Nonomuraea spiralis]
MQILDLLTGLLQVASAAAGLYTAITPARRQLARRAEGEPGEPPVRTPPATAPRPSSPRPSPTDARIASRGVRHVAGGGRASMTPCSPPGRHGAALARQGAEVAEGARSHMVATSSRAAATSVSGWTRSGVSVGVW